MDRRSTRASLPRRNGSGFFVGAVAAAFATPLSAQVTLRDSLGPADDSRHGGELAVLPDLDGDGIAELLVAAPVAGSSSRAAQGHVDLLSGATGALLRFHDGAAGDFLGASMAVSGDLDGDGVAGYLLSAYRRASGAKLNAGAVDAISGATGALIWSAAGTTAGDEFGYEIAALDDLDGDGLRETGVLDQARHAFVIDGRGALKWSLNLGNIVAPLSIAQLHDLDGDGIGDLGVGDPFHSGALGNDGQVQLFSGASGASLGAFAGAAADDSIGLRLLALPDVNGDLVPDFAVSGRAFFSAKVTAGMVQARSGADGSVLWSRQGAKGEYFGAQMARCGDFTGDGFPDLCAAAFAGGADGVGSVRMMDGRDGRKRHEIEGVDDPLLVNEAGFGLAVASGDWNGDGIGDLAIGIPDRVDHVTGDRKGAARLALSCPSAAAVYGSGFAGTLGVPTLALTGEPALGATVTLTADNSVGATTNRLLLLGFAATSVVLRSGATLLVDQPLQLPITLPAAGFVDADTLPDDPALCFLELFLQVVQIDAGAVGGLSFTQGLELRVGYDL